MKSFKQILISSLILASTIPSVAAWQYEKKYEDINAMFETSVKDIQSVDAHFPSKNSVSKSLSCLLVDTKGTTNVYSAKTYKEVDQQGRMNYVLALKNGKSVILQKYKKNHDGVLVYSTRNGETRLLVNATPGVSGLVGRFTLNLWGPIVGDYFGNVFVCK